METVKERAKSIIDMLNYEYTLTDSFLEVVKCHIIKALKEQDKITRHACAEIAINQGGKVLNSDVRSELHRKIMNVKAI